jgi:hypothetical protein
MDTNGDGALAHLAARTAALEAALEIIRRALEQTWRPRLADLERDVDVLLELLAQGGDVAAELKTYTTECRRARVRAAEGESDAC